MGNVDSRSKFESGYFMIATDKPFYEPGEVITGKVYIRCSRPIDAKHIELKIKGKEKGSWMDTVHKTVRNPDGSSTVETEKVKRKHRREIMDSKAPCFVFNSNLVPGDYVVPFGFQLPENVPSTMFFKDTHDHRKPKAQVKYSIKGSLETRSDKNEMSYKQILIVREKPPHLQEDITKASENKITTWCCVDQGVSKIQVQFDKNTFMPHEKCKSEIKLDNSRCNIALNTVRFTMEQEITIKCGTHIYRSVRTIKEKHDNGVPARSTQVGEKELEIDLSEIKYPVPQHRKKQGQLKAVSIEDAFQMSQAQPACHGHIVKNEYYLAVRTVFDGCTCCADLPMARIPLVIIPVVNPQLVGFQVPKDYNPQVHEYCQVTLRH
ncbi:UNKNOWN [Stylonychia lemnae]|uniref:Arrestin-like N-terminal domain-containing protein n=1 Tax=Stylonychia lemnae TaxID=5949 RepID=A0A078A919_STYLE|nr:UNKNOWN [Stylonychia lemnae]|eukprot:CDW78366.1 UNKNOWN [Stylonychia lemnae]